MEYVEFIGKEKDGSLHKSTTNAAKHYTVGDGGREMMRNKDNGVPLGNVLPTTTHDSNFVLRMHHVYLTDPAL